MTTAYVADTGVFVRCDDPDNEKFHRLRRALRGAAVSLLVPRRVYEELDYTNPTVSTVMDETRRFIANETGRQEDTIEKADTALVGLAAQLLNTGEADEVVLLATDKPAGRAAERLLPDLCSGLFAARRMSHPIICWAQNGLDVR
jgi:hypothetical protein